MKIIVAEKLTLVNVPDLLARKIAEMFMLENPVWLEREIQMSKKVKELHKKYGNFDEECLFKVYIRLFGTRRVTT